MRRTLATAWGLALLALSSAAEQGQQTGLPRAKNVLVIVLDDVGTDKLDFYGETPPTVPHQPCVAVPLTHIPPYAYTPRLDQLRQNGIMFRNAYANPVCSPSRSCILTGRYAFRTGVGYITNEGSFKLSDSEVLIPELLKNGFPGPIQLAGLPYKCGAFGKWHLTYKVGNEGHAIDNGFDRFYGSISNVAAFGEDYFDWSKIEDNADGVLPVPFNTTTWHGTATSTDAKNWINAQNRAFFAYVCFNPPHTPLQAPPQALVSAATWNEIVCWGGSEGHELPPGSPVQLQRLYYRAMLEAVDKEIDNLILGISQAKLDNTMIFVIGDNGTPGPIIETPPHTSGHGKGTVYEWGVRVPLLVSGPLVPTGMPPEGWTSDALVGAVDLWSTIAELTGANPNAAAPGVTLDSVSFLPVILNPASHPGTRSYAFSQLFKPNGVPPPPPDQNLCFGVHNRCISDGQYKYIRKQVEKDPPTCTTPTYTEEFYSIAGDREETFDFLLNGGWTPGASAAYQAMKAEMDAVSQP